MPCIESSREPSRLLVDSVGDNQILGIGRAGEVYFTAPTQDRPVSLASGADVVVR